MTVKAKAASTKTTAKAKQATPVAKENAELQQDRAFLIRADFELIARQQIISAHGVATHESQVDSKAINFAVPEHLFNELGTTNPSAANSLIKLAEPYFDMSEYHNRDMLRVRLVNVDIVPEIISIVR